MEITKPKEEFIAREIDYPDIAQQITAKIISGKNRTSACNSIWASEVGHDCMRYLVYQQCDWDKAKPTEDRLLLVFNEGNLQEDQLLLELQKAGVKIRDLQISIKVAEANISGKLDCVAEVESNLGELACIPVEIKSMSDIVFNSVNTVEDFKKYAWTRKYYAQMMIYLKNDLWFYPYGYFLAKNKSTGAIKLIKDFDGSNTIKFNEDYWNALIKRAKGVNKAVFINKQLQIKIAELESKRKDADETQYKIIDSEIEKLQAQYCYPERIKYDLKVCRVCKYEHICIADLSEAIGNIVENESVLESIEDYVKAKKNQGQFKEAEKAYKTALENLKGVFPLKDSLYMTDKYIVQTKVRKLKGSEYLAFDVKTIEEIQE